MVPIMIETLETMRRVALSCLSIPYFWGGNSPITGFDCSGFLQHILLSAGLDPPGDQTAQSLYDHFDNRSMTNHGLRKLGALAFYGRSVTKISHCAFILNGFQIIHASGGDRTTVSIKSPYGFVKVTHMDYRKDLVDTLMPDYGSIGVAR